MSNEVTFQMWGSFRESLITGHHFYVEQARKRLLSQFDNMDEEAEKAANEWLDQYDHLFDPDRDDPASFYDMAHDVSIEFYQLLSEMRERTRLSVVAGMFHEWEKQLRNWLVREFENWGFEDDVLSEIWKSNFREIIDLLESFNWPVRSQGYFVKLDACRLVVNVYKHGDGNSLAALRKRFPEYLIDPLPESMRFSGIEYLDHTNLQVSDEQIQYFSDAIVAFWQDVPEIIYGSQIHTVPDWLEKALNAAAKTTSKPTTKRKSKTA